MDERIGPELGIDSCGVRTFFRPQRIRETVLA
jgi:hypothetical protein